MWSGTANSWSLRLCSNSVSSTVCKRQLLFELQTWLGNQAWINTMQVLSAIKTNSFTSYAARKLAEFVLLFDCCSFVDILKSSQEQAVLTWTLNGSYVYHIILAEGYLRLTSLCESSQFIYYVVHVEYRSSFGHTTATLLDYLFMLLASLVISCSFSRSAISQWASGWAVWPLEATIRCLNRQRYRRERRGVSKRDGEREGNEYDRICIWVSEREREREKR